MYTNHRAWAKPGFAFGRPAIHAVQAYDVSLASRPADTLRPRTAADGSGIADEHAIRDRPRTSSAARGQTAEERRPPARQRALSIEAVP